MLQRVRYLFVVLVTLFVMFRTTWSGGILFGINMLFHDFHLSCELLFMKLSLLKISSCDMVLFRLSDTNFIGVIGKMLITYSLIAQSLIACGLIYALDVSFPFAIVLGVSTISWLSNLSGDRSLKYVLTRLMRISPTP
jgi:hypothetical protein